MTGIATLTQPSSDAARHAGKTILVFAALLVAQLLCVAVYFPLGGLVSSTPLLHIDHAYHWYQLRIAGLLWQEHMLVGFDPTFAAGYVGGLPLNASAKVPALLTVALDGICSPEVVYKLYVVVASVLAPSAALLAASQCRTTTAQQAIAATLGFVLWWASGFHWYHTAGMVSYVLAAFLALPWAIAVGRALTADRVPAQTLLAIGLVGAVGFLLHPHFPVIAALMTLPMLVGRLARKQASRIVLRASILGAVALLVNLPWLKAMLSAPPSDIAAAPYQKFVDPLLIVQSTIGVWAGHSQGAKINLALMLGTLCALWLPQSPSARRMALHGLGGWLLLSVVGALGAVVPLIANLQPNRWLLAAFLPLVVPAAMGITAITQRMRGPSLRTVAMSVLAGLCVALPLAWSVKETAEEILPGDHGRYGAPPPELRPVGPTTLWLIDWLKSNTTREARVMFETSLGRVHDGAHIAGYLAAESQREFIGGPYPYLFGANAWDGVAFGRPLHDLTPEAFTKYLRDYNIGWIVAHSPALQDYLSDIRSVHLTAQHSGLRTYRVDSPPGYFLEGRGRLQSSAVNHIRVIDVVGSRAVLSYHFVPGLRAVPSSTRLVPVSRAGHDIPFIGIENAPVGPVDIYYRP